MVKLIATLGTSPGGVFETFLNLSSGKYNCEECSPKPINIDEVYVVTTRDPQVELAWNIVKVLFICCTQSVTKLNKVPVDINDITSPKEYREFVNVLEKFVNEGDYVDFTGGRKSMSVAAVIVAKSKKANIVTTIIPQQDYNRISDEIKRINKEELESYVKNLDSRSKCIEKFNNVICRLASQNAVTILFD